MKRQNLDEWLNYISSTHPSEIDLGLGRVKTVFDRMSFNLDRPEIIVVSGTNGKGSTIALMEAGFRSLDYRVGSYTSPHILHYNERVKINTRPISDHRFISAFENVEKARQNISLTYFEFGTLAAFDILFSSELDVVILEVGLGGRLDAVNVVDADLDIISSVGLDHTDWLGDSIEGIGFEKAGILRPDTLFLAGENLPESVFDRSKELGSPTKVYSQHFGVDSQRGVFLEFENKTMFFGDIPELRIPQNNILLALQAVATISSSIHSSKQGFVWSKVKNAFEITSIPGRLEKLTVSQEIYLDVGHNPDAARFLKLFLNQQSDQGKTIQVVYSSLVDKDVESIVGILAPLVDHWFIAPLEVERAMEQKDLESKVGRKVENMLLFPTIPDAIRHAVTEHSNAGGKSIVTLIFGSFFIIEAAKHYFEGL